MALVIALLTGVTPAAAVPASKMDQARAVKKQIDALDHKVEAAAERYNEASDKHDGILKDQRKVEKKLKRIKSRMGVVQVHLNTRASSMYRQGPMGFVGVLLGMESFDEFARTWDLLRDLNESDARSVAELKSLRSQAKSAHAELSAKERAAAAQVAVMKKRKNEIEDQLAARQSKLAGIEAEIAALEAEEEAERARDAARLVESNSSDEEDWKPSRPARGGVIGIATSRLGAPYRWAASGPNRFDCSGFTMWVYRQLGVSLPHSSRAQIRSGERVSRANLEPGDLVFFGSPIHHVGIYMGGGRYIHAPHTGDVVKISSMSRGDYAGASRP